MGENCRDCLLVDSLEKRVKLLESSCIEINGKVGELEKAIAVSDERFKQVFEKLDEIILILRNKDEESKQEKNRLPNYVWSVLTAVTAGVVMVVVNLIMRA
ncbi:hypothetical protein [Acetobacterium wieringae]|uniref:hypothetical protein n=1 Tax=Acetobacterium wieringae TaxID=52694 RepID=UPI00315888F0